MDTNLIIVSEYCRICHIEPSFILKLEKGGLIEINIIEGVSYLSIIGKTTSTIFQNQK